MLITLFSAFRNPLFSFTFFKIWVIVNNQRSSAALSATENTISFDQQPITYIYVENSSTWWPQHCQPGDQARSIYTLFSVIIHHFRSFAKRKISVHIRSRSLVKHCRGYQKPTQNSVYIRAWHSKCWWS